MSVFFMPVMFSDDGKTLVPVPPGRKLNPDIIPVDPGKYNLLEMREDGLCVAPSNLVSGVTPNALEIAPDSALRVGLGMTLKEDNSLVLTKSDGTEIASVKLPAQAGLPVMAELLADFTPPAQDMDGVLTPLPEGTYLHLQFKLSDGTRKDLYMNVQQLVDVYEAGFAIIIEDKKVSVDTAKLLNVHEKVLTVSGDTIRTQLGLAFAEAKEELQLLGKDKEVVARVKIPVSLGTPTAIALEKNREVPGFPVSDYLRFDFTDAEGEVRSEYVAMGSLAEAPEAGDGIDINGRVISVQVDGGHGLGFNKAKELTIKPSELLKEGEQIISESNGELFTTLGLKMQGAKLVLTGIGDKGIASAQIPVGGVPVYSEVLFGFTPPPQHGQEGEPKKGTYIHFHYDVPEEYDVYIDITDAAGYPGPGISIVRGVISLKIAEGKGLKVNPETDEAYVDIANIVSVDPQNVLGQDAKGNLLLKLNDIIEPTGALMVNANGKLDIDMSKIKAPVSDDTDNALMAGKDGKPYLPGDPGTL